MYKLNDCLLSGIFEKRFGLVNFAAEYHHLVAKLNAEIKCVNEIRCRTIADPTKVKFWLKKYQLFRKLSHFFDDFNFFINIQLSPKITQERYSKFSSVDAGFQAFIRRVESMKIPQQTQDTIAGFLEMQRAFLKMQRTKAALVATRENSILTPQMLPKGDLNILHGKCNQKINEFERFRLIHQLNSTGNKFPELRLGQLISNSLPKDTDIFYVPDDKLIQLLKDFEAQHGLS